jgi:DNA repair protein RecO
MRLDFDAFIISAKEYGENSAIISTFSKEYGIKKGIAKNINKKKQVYQSGNLVNISWFGREESLGVITGESVMDYGQKFMHSKYKLLILMSLCGVLDSFLHDGDTSHGDIFDSSKRCFDFILKSDDISDILMAYLLQEIEMIKSLGLLRASIDLSCIKSINRIVLDEYEHLLHHYNKKISKYRLMLSSEIQRAVLN